MAAKDASGQAPLHSETLRWYTISIFSAGVFLMLLGQGQLASAQTAPRRFDENAAPPTNIQQLKVMAVVNGEQITRQALGNECLRRYGKEVLESMVNRQIILGACQSRGINITNQDVEDEIRQVSGKFGLSVDRWLSLLEEERNVDPQQYRRDIIWPTLALRRLAAAQTEVTEDELRRVFESEYGPKVKARMIALSIREKAEQLRQRAAANPDDFATLAKEYSEDKTSASAYGVIPPIRRYLGDPNLEEIAFALKEGEVSQVITVGNQHIILKCDKQMGRTLVSNQDMTAIQKRLTEQIAEHKTRTESAKLFQQLQSKAEIINVQNDVNLQKKYPGIAAVVSGRNISLVQLSNECVVRHGTSVLDGEINRLLLVQELSRNGKTVQSNDIDQEVARAADSYNYLKADGTPDVDAWLKAITEGDDTTIDLYVRDAVWPTVALKSLVESKIEINQDDLQKGFESNFGPRAEVLAIVMSNHRQAQEVWEKARLNPTDEYFGELAHQYSIEPTSRSNYGKVPPIRRHGGQPEMEKEAFGLEAGELSGIVAAGENFIILRCLGRTKPVVSDINLVKEELVKDIREKKLRIAMAKEFDRLKETAQVDNYLAGTSQIGKRLGAPTASPASYQQPAAAGRPATRR